MGQSTDVETETDEDVDVDEDDGGGISSIGPYSLAFSHADCTCTDDDVESW